MNTIVNLHVIDPKNIGDYLSSPLQYFNFPGFETQALDIHQLQNIQNIQKVQNINPQTITTDYLGYPVPVVCILRSIVSERLSMILLFFPIKSFKLIFLAYLG
jgi:hypothetical protein